MTTTRLYYEDAQLREFEANVVECRNTEAGASVRLDRTAFYPTSGGQPHDTGLLDGIAVMDVWEDEQGELWHTLAAPLNADRVTGRIDWERRFEHMQQHTGQHLLSAAFVDKLGASTVGFHLGREVSTIDLELAQLTWDTAHEIEQSTNRIIWENRPVSIHFVDQAQLSRFPLRKPPKVEGTVRVIWVQGYDASACGGTHVAMTGEIGLLKITNIERYKGGVRVEFLCGGRAMLQYQQLLQGMRGVCAQLSVSPDEVLDALTRIQAEARTLRRTQAKMQSEMALLEADRLWVESPEQDGVRWIVAHWSDKSFGEIRSMAARLRERASTVALLAVTEAGGVRIVCGRSADLHTVDSARLLGTTLAILQGRGGGSAELAQGGAPEHPSGVVVHALQEAVRQLMREL